MPGMKEPPNSEEASIVCPQAAAPPSGAPPECVSDRAEQLDVSARSSPYQMADRQGPAETRHTSALACGGGVLGNLCLSVRLFRACGHGELPDRPESRFPHSARYLRAHESSLCGFSRIDANW